MNNFKASSNKSSSYSQQISAILCMNLFLKHSIDKFILSNRLEISFESWIKAIELSLSADF